MPLRMGKTTTTTTTTTNGEDIDKSSSSSSRNNNRFILPVVLILIFLAILQIGSEQIGLKGFKASTVGFSTTLNSATTTIFKSPSTQLKEYILEENKNNNNALEAEDDDDYDEEKYLEWLLQQRQEIGNWTQHSSRPPKNNNNINVLYRAMAGLGHQFMRMSSAYHLLSMYQIPLLWPTANPVCGGTIFTIYEHLIGAGPILVNVPFMKQQHNSYNKEFVLPVRFPNLEYIQEAELSDEERENLQRTINLNNEVPMYSHAVGDLWDRALERFEQMNFFYKFQTDYQMYHQLMLLFGHKHKQRIQEIADKTRFENHTVFALHIRTGNGEKGDFELKQRGIANLDQWIETVIELFCDYREQNKDFFVQKPLMLYVGTDTGSVVPKLQNVSSSRCQIPVVSADQEYPEEGQSVSFLQKYNDHQKCLKGWEDMFLDMYFFTKANTVVTGSYSSYTQSAPMSFMMHKAKKNNAMNKNSQQHPHYFCELGPRGNRMDCYQDMANWLKRTEAKSWGNMTAREQRVKQEYTFPNWRVKSVSITKLFEKTVLREVKRTTGSSSSGGRRKSLNRLTFQEWFEINGNASSSASKANYAKAGIQGTQRGPS